MALNLLLVDDHAIVRQGIRQLLLDRRVADEVAEAESGAEALAAADKGSFDVILLDISLPDINGVEVLKRLKRKLPSTPVLMFSMYREDQYAVRALKAGAAGYLSKTVNAAQMIAAIQQVAAGRKYVSPALAEALAEYVLVRERAAAAREAVRPRIPDALHARLGQAAHRHREHALAVGEDGERLPHAPAREDEAVEQRRADLLRDEQPPARDGAAPPGRRLNPPPRPAVSPAVPGYLRRPDPKYFAHSRRARASRAQAPCFH